ncbi:anti-phage dCTP deaminase [Paucibacter sp. XJ19-41]|uniref:anti-phage dCTP deaminase n=1 Tax=Paucibacter sp. XJ19-41 TaxID=2927824 RepID=UPI00234B10E8|nr:anti-phage dCTP deaminase [Paucibacter sp. XJ19-41]MDC6167642.1 anti-phage dCTP deaminase [Paucibacter sp. XJ19-41]
MNIKNDILDTQGIDASNSANIELVFGFVGPTGIDLDKVCDVLKNQLKTVQYEVVEIRLSDLITAYLRESSSFSNSYERVKSLMARGTRLREETGQADVVARLAIAAIREVRKNKTGDVRKPAQRVAYLVRSFKRPEEVELFRQVYGKAFTLISVYASKLWRSQFLKKAISTSLSKDKTQAERYATELITIDHDEEGKKLGQKVGKTFPLADFFVTSESRPDLEKNLKRLTQLTFGNPYISPTRDEQAMFFAKAAALRSLDLSRQVGAAVVSSDGDLLTTGCNEVPKFGGGLYWGEDYPVDRDFERGTDSNVTIKKEIVEDVFARLRSKGFISKELDEKSNADLTDEALFHNGAYLKDSQIFDVIEFGRAVHAEMAAITQAARVGVSLQNSRLFCTTFPCHICARHIVSSGVREVVFIEPYEKSRASDLFGDSISVEPVEASSNRVNFRAFVGVAPRRYMDFFEFQGSRKTNEGKIRALDEQAAAPRIKRFVFTYTFAEAFAVDATLPLPSAKKGRSKK